MQYSLVLNSPLLPFKHSLPLDPILDSKIPFQSNAIGWKSPSPTPSFLIPYKTQTHKWVIFARKSRWRNGSQRSMKLMLELISILGLNPQILPPPLGLLMGELSEGGEGRLGFLRNFSGGIFNGWKRKRKRKTKVNSIFWVSLGLFSLWLLLGKMLKLEVIFGILGFCFLGDFLIKKWRKGIKDWVFGICCVAFLFAQVVKGEDVVKLCHKIRVSSPMVEEIAMGARKKGRRGAF